MVWRGLTGLVDMAHLQIGNMPLGGGRWGLENAQWGLKSSSEP